MQRLTLNGDKTRYMVFLRKQRDHPSSTKELALGNNIILRVTNVKFLGLIIDESLTWVPQVNNIVKFS